jgi:mannose-6-phosphate isomerase-like protein (cupin superfamily)
MKRDVGLLRLIKQELDSYQKYESGELKVIGLPDLPHIDCVVNQHMSYAVWLNTRTQYPTVKVEGLERTISKFFKKFKTQDIHLFVNQKSAFSFKWHYDTVDVFLYVVKGVKKLQVKNKTYILRKGQGALIPKGHLHRAFSLKDTWALSVGLK